MIAVDLDDKNATAVSVAAYVAGQRLRIESADAGNATVATPEIEARRAMGDLIKKHTDRAMKTLADASEKIEQLRLAIQKRGDQQVASLGEYAGFVEQSEKMADVIMGPINELADTVRKATDP